MYEDENNEWTAEVQVTRQSVKSGIINQTLPSAPRGKLRWMPKMWLHHHIDSEHKCSFRFAVSGLKTLPVTSSRPLFFPRQLLHRHILPVTCQLCKVVN